MEGHLIDGSNYRVHRTSRGTAIEIDFKKGKAGGGWTWRGEWSPKSYDIDDVVRVSGGSNAGTYLCIQAASSTSPAPYEGERWVKIADLTGGQLWQ